METRLCCVAPKNLTIPCNSRTVIVRFYCSMGITAITPSISLIPAKQTLKHASLTWTFLLWAPAQTWAHPRTARWCCCWLRASHRSPGCQTWPWYRWGRLWQTVATRTIWLTDWLTQWLTGWLTGLTHDCTHSQQDSLTDWLDSLTEHLLTYWLLPPSLPHNKHPTRDIMSPTRIAGSAKPTQPANQEQWSTKHY